MAEEKYNMSIDEVIKDEDLFYANEQRKAKARRARKSKQRAKEKLLISGHGHSIIKRLEKEKFNEVDFEWEEPKYIEYERYMVYKPFRWFTEDELDYYREWYKLHDDIKIVPTKYYKLCSGEPRRVYKIYRRREAKRIVLYNKDDEDFLTGILDDEDCVIPVSTGKYEFSDFWDKLFIEYFGNNIKDTFYYPDNGRNKRIDGKARDPKYKKKLKKYQELESSSKILKKKRTYKKVRSKTKNITDKAKKYDFDSDEYIDLMSILPTKDTAEYIY